MATAEVAKAAKYTMTIRNATVRNSLSLGTDHVAGASHGMQERPLEPLVDLRAQPRNVHVDHIRLRIEMVLPHTFQEHRSRHHLACVPHEIFQQAKLARLKVDRRAVALRGS